MLNAKELIDILQQELQDVPSLGNISKKEVALIANVFTKTIAKYSAEGIRFHKFGTFTIKTSPAGAIKNVKTGLLVNYPAKQRLFFKQSKK
jgi:nucleoid DNA-binding protein